MKKIKRLFRHLWITSAHGKRTFPQPVLDAIQTAIAKGEKQHRAEIRLIIEPSLPFYEVWQGTTTRQRARELFAEYRIWDTEENCGILIYINLADHKVEIIADRTVGRILNAEIWQSICQTMTRGFAQGIFETSTVSAIERLNALLHETFPDDGASANQLSNRPLVL